MKELMEYARTFVKEHPEHKSEVSDLIQLCVDEIEEGGSSEHEISLCYSSIKELLEQK